MKGKYDCPECPSSFSRRNNRDRHVKAIHGNEEIVNTCDICKIAFNNVKDLKKHRREHKVETGFVLLERAFKKTCCIYRKEYSEKMETLEQSFHNDKKDMEELLKFELEDKKRIKVALVFTAEFLRTKHNDPTKTIEGKMSFYCPPREINRGKEIRSFLHQSRVHAQGRIDDFINNGSGWQMDEILFTDIQLGQCAPLNASCNLLSITHPKSLKKIKYSGEMKRCFLEAVAYHFTGKKNKKALDKFIKRNIIVTVPMPMEVKKIKKFEKDNAHLNIFINVLYAEGDDIYPLLVSKRKKTYGEKNNIMNLLLYKTRMNGRIVSHFSYIEDLDKLLRRTYKAEECPGSSKKVSYEKSYRCPNCLQKFYKKSLVLAHEEKCLQNKPQTVNVPEAGETIKFDKFNKKFLAPIVGFFDFEAVQEAPRNRCEKCLDVPTCQHKTTIHTVQNPVTYSLLIIKSKNNKVIYKKTYSGEDCAENLVRTLLNIEQQLLKRLRKYSGILPTLTQVEDAIFKNALNCHICEKPLYGDKVLDHCHATGDFLGASHNACNLNRRVQEEIPLFCHNLQGYDSHFIMHALKQGDRIKRIEGLPLNTEKFRTITINSFVCLDSLAFLSASLSEISNDLARNKNHPFEILDQMELYSRDEKKKKKLLLRKGVYPYEYVTSLNMLKETKGLPGIAKFHSILMDTTISEEDYMHALNVYETFECENLLEYSELYCATDVALLCEAMLQLRHVIHKEYELDCCHYLSTPQLAYDMMLKSTGVEIELLSDIDMILFLEQNIRGKRSRSCI